MFSCPHCHTSLVRKLATNGVFWLCDRCDGRAMAIGLLRKSIDEKIVAALWAQALDAPTDGPPCPVCARNMTEVEVPVNGSRFKLDVCKRCEFVWFDSHEYESMPMPQPKPRPLGQIDEATLPATAREALAMERVEELAKQRDAEDPIEAGGWKSIPGLFGLPVEMDPPERTRRPWATYLTGALIAAISIVAFFHLKEIIPEWGMVPADLGRHHGLTFVTSFFLHAGIFHLVGNLYFLIVFGTHVENDLGWRRWIGLLVLAALFGDMLHILGNPHSTLPCIGASGGISGLIAFYALKFPYARLGFLFRYYLFFRWIQLPAWSAFLLWVLFQFWGSFQQVRGYSQVASLAHLGGCVVGLAAWLLWRNLDAPSAAQSSFPFPIVTARPSDRPES